MTPHTRQPIKRRLTSGRSPVFPDGYETWVCRTCKRVPIDIPRCLACGNPATKTIIYNEATMASRLYRRSSK